MEEEEKEEEEEEEEGGVGGVGGVGRGTVGRGAEGVRDSFELDENEQQPSKLLELLTMSTYRRQPRSSAGIEVLAGF